MPSRDFPERPNLDHLKNEAKALRQAFVRGDADAVARVRAVLGADDVANPRLTDVQRVIAREYGFPTWARLRTHVQAARGIEDAVNTFLGAIMNRDTAAALEVIRVEPKAATASIHVAAALGLHAEVQRLIDADPARVHARIGPNGATPLLWLCFAPFHGESPERDEGLFATAQLLLKSGADPNAKDTLYGVPALYGVTGLNNSLRIAKLLLDAGANPTDGESVHHSAEHFNEEALELLLSYGADLNRSGDWGNTPLYFLLRYWDVAARASVKQGVIWLVHHGADPNVLCGDDRENCLHLAARRGQQPEVISLFIDRITDINERRADGRTAWMLATRGGFDAIVALLEEHGATREVLTTTDALMAACGRGNAEAARLLATPQLVSSLAEADQRLLPEAAANTRFSSVEAYIAAGFPIDTLDNTGATALHFAALHGNAELTRMLLRAGAAVTIRDREHNATAFEWAVWGRDNFSTPGGNYAATIEALR